MFLVRENKTNEMIGIIDKPFYIKYDADSNTLFPIDLEKFADGIAIDGTAYNVGTEEKIPNAPCVHLDEIDTGEYIFFKHNEIVKNTEDITQIQNMILNQDNTIGILEEAIMDLDNQMTGGE